MDSREEASPPILFGILPVPLGTTRPAVGAAGAEDAELIHQGEVEGSGLHGYPACGPLLGVALDPDRQRRRADVAVQHEILKWLARPVHM